MSARTSPAVTSKLTVMVTVKTKPISKEAAPLACQGVGPSSDMRSRTLKSVREPVRTASMAEISAMK